MTKRTSLTRMLPLLCLLAGCSGDDDAAGSGKGDPSAGSGAGLPGTGSGANAGSGASSGPGSGSDDGSGGPGSIDPNLPAAPGVPPTFSPKFPGAGSSGDDAPLTNGELCDFVPLDGAPTPNEITKCFFGMNDPVPAATLEQVLECVDGADVVHIRLTFNPSFVDNTYGVNAIGWPGKKGHTFEHLHKSDHAEIVMTDGNGDVAFQFKLDYLTADPSAPSGWASLGVGGGDGEVITGDAAWLLDWNTSIAKNLNERGHDGYTLDSPATNADYDPNPATPDWDYRVVYEAWVDVSAFGDAGFGGAEIEFVHASPSKADNSTIEVEPKECPPGFCTDPDGCYDGPPPPDSCTKDPDAPCGDSDLPPEGGSGGSAGTGGSEAPDAGAPLDCLEIPDDPRCRVD